MKASDFIIHNSAFSIRVFRPVLRPVRHNLQWRRKARRRRMPIIGFAVEFSISRRAIAQSATAEAFGLFSVPPICVICVICG